MGEKYDRILIVEVNWLGDVLFSTPLIRAVRERFKNARIACMIHPRTREVLEYNPRINEIIIYDEKDTHGSLWGKLGLTWLLRKKKFDLAILLHRSFTRSFLAYLGGIRERVGYVTKKRAALLTIPVETPESQLHKVEYFLGVGQVLGCDISNKDYELFTTDRERKYIEGELSKNGIRKEDFLVVINPGGNWLPKRWPERNYAKLGDSLMTKYAARLVIAGAKTDEALALRIKNEMKENPVIFCGRTNLKELAALMERANFVISGDTGPMHMAVAMKSNVIALFGPTSPAITGPYGSGNYRVIRKDIGCEIPCYDLSCTAYRCMDAITVDDVLRVFEEMYSGRTCKVKSEIRNSKSETNSNDKNSKS